MAVDDVPDVSDAVVPGAASTASSGARCDEPLKKEAVPGGRKFADMSSDEKDRWMKAYSRQAKDRYGGLERALREQLVSEGRLPASALWEDTRDDPTTTIELCVDEEFERTFTEAALGLALNVGPRGAIIVKRCVPGSSSASRRIPPGVMLTHIAGVPLEHPSLKEVQALLQGAERPLTLRLRQTEASLALAQASVRAAEAEREAYVRAIAAAKARYEEEMIPAPLETAAAFERTYTEARLGLCLSDASSSDGTRRRTVVRKCVPRTPSWKSGLPPDVVIVAINGKSVEFRRFKEVKKLIELAQRPVTIAFSAAEEPIAFPAGGRAGGSDRRGGGTVEPTAVPAYVRRPV